MPDLKALRLPFSACILMLLLPIFWLLPAQADDSAATYDNAVAMAQAIAANPGPWTVSNLKVITGPGTGDGNTYVNGNVVVGNFTRSSYFQGVYPGKSLTVYGQPGSSATWVTVGGELKSYLAGIGVTAANVKAETSRALGMFTTNSNDCVAELLVTPSLDFIQRPTKDPSIAVQPGSLGSAALFVKPAGMSDTAYANFISYYNYWKASAYGASHFPWTQLGYTYRWGVGDSLYDIRGLSEFILPGGSQYTFYAIYTPSSYLYTAGNGSGDFNVTGELDTLWTGRNFQPRGDTVLLAAGVVVSGGQGLLISSPGYTVTNYGTITGPTSAKFGLPGTRDVAILFQGQAPPAGAMADPYGSGNTLVNAGTIDSPGTAVRADAGNTTIVNTGVISGGVYAVRTADGDDLLELRGGTLKGRVDMGSGNDSLITFGNATLSFTLSPDGSSQPSIVNVETVRLGDGAKLSVTFDSTGYVRDGRSYRLIEARSLSVPNGGLSVSSNLPMVRFQVASDGANLTVTSLRDLGWYTRRAVNASLGGVLDGIAATANPDMQGVLGLLDQTGNVPGSTARLLPGPQTRITVLSTDAASAFSSAFAARMSGLRGGELTAAGLVPAGFRSLNPERSDLYDLGRSAASGRVDFDAAPWRAALPAPSDTGLDPTSDGPIETFASVYGTTGQGSSSGGAPGYVSSLAGAMYGLGARVLPGVHVGLLGGYAWSRADFNSGDSELGDHIWRAGPYVSLDFAPYSLDAMAAFGAHQLNTRRSIWGSTAQANTTMREFLGYLRAARTVDLGSAFRAEPFAEAQYLALHRDAGGESGAGGASLNTPASDSASATTVLGLRLEKTFRAKRWRFTPGVWGGWRHEYANTSPLVRASFVGAPDREFVASGGELDRDQARFGAGLTLLNDAGPAINLRFDGMAGKSRSDMALSLGMRLTF